MKLLQRAVGISATSKSNRCIGLSMSSFSTNTNPEGNVKKEKFQTQRNKYQTELHKLRRNWQDVIAKERKAEEVRKDAEKQKVILEQAMKLREARKLSAQRQEELKRARAEALLRYKEHLARTQLTYKQREAENQLREKYALRDLQEESSHWITMQNLEEKICEDLFARPAATTGLEFKNSEYWKYHAFTPSLQRLTSDSNIDRPLEQLDPVLITRSRIHTSYRMGVEDFLHSMINSGEDRANFAKYVKKYSKAMKELGAMDKLYEEAAGHIPSSFDWSNRQGGADSEVGHFDQDDRFEKEHDENEVEEKGEDEQR